MPSPVEMSTFYYLWQKANDLQDAAMWGLFFIAVLFALAWKASSLVKPAWRTRARWAYLVQVVTILTMMVWRVYVH